MIKIDNTVRHVSHHWFCSIYCCTILYTILYTMLKMARKFVQQSEDIFNPVSHQAAAWLDTIAKTEFPLLFNPITFTCNVRYSWLLKVLVESDDNVGEYLSQLWNVIIYSVFTFQTLINVIVAREYLRHCGMKSNCWWL